MPKEYYTAIQYGYGETLVDNLFTEVEFGSNGAEKSKQVVSLSTLKEVYVQKLNELDTTEEKTYSQLAPLVSYLGEVVNKMPGTADFADERFNQYVLSQYDIIGGDFPKNVNEAVLVVGQNNDVTDLTLVQLGLLSEEEFFTTLYSDDKKQANPVPFEEIIGKKYVLYNNDGVYTKNDDLMVPYAFNYQGTRAELNDENRLLAWVAKVGLCKSNKEARQTITAGGLSVNDEKITDTRASYSADTLREGVMLRRGKKSYKKVVLN